MAWWKQTALALVLVCAAAVLWAFTVPAAAPVLARLGISAGEDAEPAEEDAPDGSGGDRDGPVLVIGSQVAAAAADANVTSVGDGRAIRSVTVTPLAPGRIVALEVASGDRVEEGDVLARLDSEAEEIALARADLAVGDAEARLDRVGRLQQSGSATDVALREARLALETARLERRDATLDLANRTITAPIAGVVGILASETGARVSTDTEIATIVDRSRILVDFRVTERLAGRLSLGDTAIVTPLAMPQLEAEAEIVALDNRVDPESRTLRVQAAIGNADDRLRGGMAFLIELALPGEEFPAVDPLAIQWGAAGAYVWVVREGRAARVPVRIMQRNSESVLVAGALARGERVVAEGMQRIREGMEIRFSGDAAPEGASGMSRAPAGVSDT